MTGTRSEPLTAPATRTPLPGPWGAALYTCRISHVRRTPLHHAFTHRTYLWLVDLDALPVLPRPLRFLARFRAADHPGDPRRSLRRNLEDAVAARGLDATGGRILMLTQARSWGHVFNPLTVYWCHRPDGTPLCTVAEVHNTYGGHHRYVLRPDPDGNSRVSKALYVSPFFPVDGGYRLSLPEPGARLRLEVRLDRGGAEAFAARVVGDRRPASPGTLLTAALRHPLSTVAVSLHIRYQGIRLLLRGLRVQPRPRPEARACPR